MEAAEVKLMAVAQGLGIAPEDADGMTPKEWSLAVRERIGSERNRPEEDIAMQVVLVTLGGQEHEIKLRPMREDREWRRKIGEVAGRLLKIMMADGSEGQDVGEMLAAAMPVIFSDGLDEIVEAFYLYSGLDAEMVEASASSDEICEAAMEVFRVFGLPFVRARLRDMQAMRGMMG